MSMHLPVAIHLLCDRCQTRGIVAATEYEIGGDDVAAVATAADLAKDGFTVINGEIVCDQCRTSAAESVRPGPGAVPVEPTGMLPGLRQAENLSEPAADDAAGLGA